MSFSVKITPDFAKEAKRIAKKQPAIKADIEKLISDLESNPTIGDNLGQNFFKVRLRISGTNKGKSGGARVITYVIIDDKTVLLTEIYVKNEYDTVDLRPLIKRLKDQGLI